MTSTASLAAAGFGFGPGEEFENGWYPAIRAGVVNDGRGIMSIDSMTVEFNPIPEPSGLLLALLALPGMMRRRR